MKGFIRVLNRGPGVRSQGSGKIRLDELLVQRGMVESCARAQAEILARNVLVNNVPVTQSGVGVAADAPIRFKRVSAAYVSRGANKLAAALPCFPVPVFNQVLIDVGQSTGGFTDVLLKQGAQTVIGVDVGYGLLHNALRNDPRVWCVERLNARKLTRAALAKWARRQKPPRGCEPLDRIAGFTMDLSFISVTKVLPAVAPLLNSTAWGLILLKPQFEAPHSQVEKGGLVTKPEVVERVLLGVCHQIAAQGWVLKAMAKAAIKGADGNQEFVLWVERLAPEGSNLFGSSRG